MAVLRMKMEATLMYDYTTVNTSDGSLIMEHFMLALQQNFICWRVTMKK